MTEIFFCSMQAFECYGYIFFLDVHYSSLEDVLVWEEGIHPEVNENRECNDTRCARYYSINRNR